MFSGISQFSVFDQNNDLSFQAFVQYPALNQSAPVSFGPYSLDASLDTEIAKGKFPLVVISHGNSGSWLLYRTISTYLAKHGYIVAMFDHFGNNRTQNELEGTPANLLYRTRHIRLTIDTVLNDPKFSSSISPHKIAVIGHSIGGSTALALAGGTPWAKDRQMIAVETDPRISALVLLTPATDFYLAPGSLQNVDVPIFMVFGEKDHLAQYCNPEIILQGIKNNIQIHSEIIKNAGHFSFLSPFPPLLKNSKFPPSHDPEGFDREKFHLELPQKILTFLNANW